MRISSAISVAAEPAASGSSANEETAETACVRIRSALNDLAKAEREEAFALDLGSKPGSSTAMVETRLAVLLDRTNHLRATLRSIRQHAPAYDQRVEQCMKMGFKALVESEKLTTTVEEFLRSREADEASQTGRVRSDAAAPASVSQP